MISQPSQPGWVFKTLPDTFALVYYLKMGHFRSLVHLILIFFKQTLQFWQQNKCENITIQYTVQGLEPTTLRT